MTSPFSQQVIDLIKEIPLGKVATYGQIARAAGNSRAARQVAWILNSSSEKYNLPWHRVVNGRGKISLPHDQGYETQKELLEKEGIVFSSADIIDLSSYQHDFVYSPENTYKGDLV